MKQVTVLIVGGLIAWLTLTQSSMAQEQAVDPSSFEAMLTDVRINGIGGEHQPLTRSRIDDALRGSIPVVSVEWFEDFQDHPISTEPVFDRFQVIPGQGQVDPAFSWEIFNGISAIPSLFVDGQVDEFGTPDPLPRWQGIALIESLPGGLSDLNQDGDVDTADLGLLIANFGETGAGLTGDINSDGIIDTADLGLLIGLFGSSIGPFCVYEATFVYPIDDSGNPLPPGALDDGPFIGDRIAFTSSPACGTCETFRLTTNGVKVFGEWTPIDTAAADLTGVAFFGNESSAGCPDLGDERVLALVRGENGLAQEAYGLNIRGTVARENSFVTNSPNDGIDLVCEMDIFMPSHETFLWTEFRSDLDGFLMSRLITGGIGADVSPQVEAFTNAAGLLDRFVIIGLDCGDPFCGNRGGSYGTVPDPDYIDPVSGVVTPLPGKNVLTGEWFTVRHVVTAQFEHEVWIRDSETMALNDPTPGDDGGSTNSILDDIEDGFAKIFPVGPFGRTRLSFGQVASNNAFPITTSATRVQMVFGAEDGSLSRAHRNNFVDNIRISGVRLIPPALPPLTLPYSDGLENYHQDLPGHLNFITAGRWFSDNADDGVIRGDNQHSGSQFLEQSDQNTREYEPVIWTNLPPVTAAPSAPWRVGAWFSNWGRGYTPMNSVTGEEVCTVLTGVLIPGVAFGKPTAIETDPETGFVPIFIRQRNPKFDPGLPIDDRLFHQQPPFEAPGDPGYPNLEFINVRTGAFVESTTAYIHLEIEVDSAGTLRLFFDGIEYFPSDPERFYDVTPGDITNFRTDTLAIDQLRFDTFNFGLTSAGIDDITLTGSPAP